MKVVLSRKGFDSKYGGMASPILPDGRLFPLPIPSNHDNATLGDLPYADIETAGMISDLSNGRHTLATGIHRDPDLDRPISADLSNWRPALGQTGAAQSHLSTKGVGPGDVFLFFGWFRLIEQVGGRWRYAKSAPHLHVLFGWLEVDEVLPIVTARSTSLQRHPWIANHPHLASPDWYTSPLNTLYIGRERSFYGPDGTLGGGRFSTMRKALQLTRPGCSRSIWSLPSWFEPRGRPPLSYHPKLSNWELGGDSVTLRSAAKGQEFVLNGEYYPELEAWAGNLIRENA